MYQYIPVTHKYIQSYIAIYLLIYFGIILCFTDFPWCLIYNNIFKLEDNSHCFLSKFSIIGIRQIFKKISTKGKTWQALWLTGRSCCLHCQHPLCIPVCVPDALQPIHLPLGGLRNSEEDGIIVGAPVTCIGDLDETSGSWIQPGPALAVGSEAADRKSLTSVSDSCL